MRCTLLTRMNRGGIDNQSLTTPNIMKKAKIVVAGQPKVVELEEGLHLDEGTMYLNEEEKVFYIEGSPLRFVMRLFRKVMTVTSKKDKNPLDLLVGFKTAEILDIINNSEELSKEQIINF